MEKWGKEGGENPISWIFPDNLIDEPVIHFKEYNKAYQTRRGAIIPILKFDGEIKQKNQAGIEEVRSGDLLVSLWNVGFQKSLREKYPTPADIPEGTAFKIKANGGDLEIMEFAPEENVA
jgi:hypothetical protein